MHDKIYISSLIPSHILQKCFFHLGLNPTKILLCNTIYHFINCGHEINPQNLAEEIKLNLKTIYENLNLIETGFIFQKIIKDCNKEEWISLFPNNKYCIAKKGYIGKNKRFINFYFQIPATKIVIQFYLPVSIIEFNHFTEINDNEYYLINYESPEILEYLPKLELITIQAYSILDIIPIRNLGFNINDQGRPYLINKNSIIEEEA